MVRRNWTPARDSSGRSALDHPQWGETFGSFELTSGIARPYAVAQPDQIARRGKKQGPAFPFKKLPRPKKTAPSDLDSISCPEPGDRRVIDVVAKCDLSQRLARRHALQGFARLMLSQLGPAAKPCALPWRGRGLHWFAAESDRARTRRKSAPLALGVQKLNHVGRSCEARPVDRIVVMLV